MIIHIKTIPTTAILTIATIISPSHAYLRSAESLQPGAYCNTSCQNVGCAVMHKYDAPYILDIIDDYDQCTDDNTQYSNPPDPCWLNKTAGNYMLCAQPENACGLFYAHDEDWRTLNSSRNSVRNIDYDASEYYFCQTTINYGCKASHYATQSISTSAISCTACPSGGKSATGNVAITGCYKPSGATGTDTTGTYKYTANCYYKI